MIAIIEITQDHKGRLHWYRDEQAVIDAALKHVAKPRIRPDIFSAAIKMLANEWYGRLIVRSEHDIPKVEAYFIPDSLYAATTALLDELRAEFLTATEGQKASSTTGPEGREQRRFKQASDGYERIARANVALDSVYVENVPEFKIEGRDKAIIDLFADLHYLAKDYGFDIDDLWRIAKGHYQVEAEES